jgi:hypothetical protein
MSAALNFGENGTLQHSWNLSDWKETLTQFYFQLIRKSFESADMAVVFQRLLDQCDENRDLQNYLLRLVVHTRDIQKGKGERDLFYHLLHHMSEMGRLQDALDILRYTCQSNAGSWKDIKYLVLSELQQNHMEPTPLATGALQLLAAQIESDYNAYQEDRFDDMSLAARWAPRREKGKFAPVTREFVKTIHASRRYSSTTMRDVRKMLALLNRDLKTPQIDMCRGTWRLLNFNSMTSYTLLKHKLAFQNRTKNGEDRSTKEDRIECAQNYTQWLNSDTKKMNVSTIYPFEFVRDVIQKKSLNGDEIKYYNDAWKTQTQAQMKSLWESNSGVGTMIPMIDVSGSMCCDSGVPLYNSIALGIRLAELNVGAFHNKALTFSESPVWHTYRDDQTFYEKVHQSQRLDWGGSTNFKAALKMILAYVLQHNMSPLAVKNLSLVVFSDM